MTEKVTKILKRFICLLIRHNWLYEIEGERWCKRCGRIECEEY